MCYRGACGSSYCLVMLSLFVWISKWGGSASVLSRYPSMCPECGMWSKPHRDLYKQSMCCASHWILPYTWSGQHSAVFVAECTRTWIMSGTHSAVRHKMTYLGWRDDELQTKCSCELCFRCAYVCDDKWQLGAGLSCEINNSYREPCVCVGLQLAVNKEAQQYPRHFDMSHCLFNFYVHWLTNK